MTLPGTHILSTNYDRGMSLCEAYSQGQRHAMLATAAAMFLAESTAYDLMAMVREFPREVAERLGSAKCKTILWAKVPGNHLRAIYRVAGMCSERELRWLLPVLYGNPALRERVAAMSCKCGRPMIYDDIAAGYCVRCAKRRCYKAELRRAYREQGFCRCGKPPKNGYTRCQTCLDQKKASPKKTPMLSAA